MLGPHISKTGCGVGGMADFPNSDLCLFLAKLFPNPQPPAPAMGAQGHTSSFLTVQEWSLPCPHGPCWVRPLAQPGKTPADRLPVGSGKRQRWWAWVG